MNGEAYEVGQRGATMVTAELGRKCTVRVPAVPVLPHRLHAYPSRSMAACRIRVHAHVDRPMSSASGCDARRPRPDTQGEPDAGLDERPAPTQLQIGLTLEPAGRSASRPPRVERAPVPTQLYSVGRELLTAARCRTRGSASCSARSLGSAVFAGFVILGEGLSERPEPGRLL